MCVCVFVRVCVCYRLHGRYRELAPHLVPLDYTNNPDIKLPLSLLVSMPELKVLLGDWALDRRSPPTPYSSQEKCCVIAVQGEILSLHSIWIDEKYVLLVKDIANFYQTGFVALSKAKITGTRSLC